MPRRLATLVVPALLLFAAPAAAQTPPDERAAAQAFADAALRAMVESEALEDELETVFKERKCENRLLERTPRRRDDDAATLLFVAWFGQLGRMVEPVMTRYSTDLHAVDTADPALRSGRTAMRRFRRFYAVMAEFPAYDSCTALRGWERNGFRPTATLREARYEFARLTPIARDLNDAFERIGRAAERMGALGVSKEGVAAFGLNGELEAVGRG
jgi:hypothetical protein